MSLLLNSQRSVTVDDVFDFVVSESYHRGVLYAHDTWLLILLIIIFFDSYKLINSNKKIMNITLNHHSSLTVFWGGATNISHHHNDNRCSRSLRCNFSWNSPFWLSWLHRCAPKQQCWLVWLLPGRHWISNFICYVKT